MPRERSPLTLRGAKQRRIYHVPFFATLRIHWYFPIVGTQKYNFKKVEGKGKCIKKERQALLDLKAALVDEHGELSSWKTEENCCKWKGVGCSSLTGHILQLDLSNLDVSLRGKIPKSIVELQHLRHLDLSLIDFGGNQIPEFFSSLTNLRHLDLSYCDIMGRIPSRIGSLLHLRYLNLGWNSLEGSIPSQLGNLSKLQNLDLGQNNLEGAIPSQLGNLSRLERLSLGYNDLRVDNGDKWLSTLTSLNYLDLSSVYNLNTSHNWIQMIGNLSKVRELALWNCDLSDHFILLLTQNPFTFKFSSSLVVLDLSGNTFTSTSILFQWLSNVTTNLFELTLQENLFKGSKPNDIGTTMNSLGKLDLSMNSFKGGDLKFLRNFCNLSSLDMSFNNLTEELPSILHSLSVGCVSNSLQELDLSYNQITGTIPNPSVFPSSLKTLDVSVNQLRGRIPENIHLPSQLESLSVSSNSIEGGIPKSFGSTCNLSSLDMSNNNLTEELPLIIQSLSGCKYSLEFLNLGNNQINGTLPNLSSFLSLLELDLSENKLSGKIPKAFQLPPQLMTLYINSNSLKGVITDSHFDNVSMLYDINLSGNSLLLAFSHDWVPPFQLWHIKLRHCKLGPSFPKWLQTQTSLVNLDVSNTGISDTIPEWFWPLSTKLEELNISYNNLRGTIPNVPLKFTEYPIISLAMNQLEGLVPPFLRRVSSLDLFKNMFSDFTSFVCSINGTAEGIGRLDLSDNFLSGQIPDCWSNFTSIRYLDLSSNNLSGNIPTSLGSILELEALILRNNSLTGELPFSLENCTKLVMLDVGENRLSGVVPFWIGSSLQQLQMLSLRRNHFFGILPSSLCYLTQIHLLDLSANNLRGRIPKCFKNFSAMISENISSIDDDHSYSVNHTIQTFEYDIIALLTWKGVDHTFNNDKLLLKSIDLSSNQLSGDIPIELGNLVELVSLNLSRNNLTGKIPSGIGRLVSLESLDLSRNHLFDSIPSSLAQIDFLSVLDLSHNNLSGKIPTGTQLQSFDASSYEENQDLCGLPLKKLCPKEGPHQESLFATQNENDGLIEAFFMSMGLGFFAGFWGIFGTILFNRSWRHAYFRFLNNITEKVMSKWQR